MRERSIFFFDFDNTLYSHQSRRIPRSALTALAALREQGHILVLISGRGGDSLPLFRSAFDIMPETVCLLNGQMILRHGKRVFERHIPQMDTLALFDAAKRNHIVYGGYTAGGLILSGVNDRVRAVWNDFGSDVPPIKQEFEKTDPIYQACLYALQEEQALFGNLLDGYVTNWSHRCLCNLISRQAGKSVSVKWCLKHFGIPTERAYAFGDGYNDMDLLAAVRHGVAMENGFPALKEAAEFIAPAPEKEGIFIALQHYAFLPEGSEAP